MQLLKSILSEKGLPTSSFGSAFAHAISLDKDINVEQSEQIRVSAALSYQKTGAVCDLGSYINAYPVVLALLGMRVLTVDYYPQAVRGHLYYKPDIERGLAIYRSVGLQVVKADIYDVVLPDDAFDVITSFETFEHLWHSPKPIVNKVQSALTRSGSFFLSIPNIVNLASRLNAMCGPSPFEPFQRYYEHGNPFTRHRREMTMAEVHWMMTTIGLRKTKLFTANPAPPCGEDASAAGRLDRILPETFPVPQASRATIFAVYKKQ